MYEVSGLGGFVVIVSSGPQGGFFVTAMSSCTISYRTVAPRVLAIQIESCVSRMVSYHRSSPFGEKLGGKLSW